MIAPRNPDGTFSKGGPGGPGRKPKPRTDYAAIFHEKLDAETAGEIIETAIAQACDGCRHARAWLFDHVISKMPVRAEVSQVDASDAQAIPDMLDQFRRQWASEDPKQDPYYVESGSADDYAE